VAFQSYVEQYNYLPPSPKLAPRHWGKDGRPNLSWRVHLLPFLDENDKQLYAQFHHDEPWDSPHNQALLPKMPMAYKTTSGPTKTSLMLLIGNGAAYEEDGKGPSPSDFKDGIGWTILVVNAGPGKAVPWTKPEDLTFVPDDPLSALSLSDEESVMVMFADSIVWNLAADMPAADWRGLITRAGGERVDYFPYRRP